MALASPCSESVQPATATGTICAATGPAGSVHRLRPTVTAGNCCTLKIYDVEQGSQEWHDVRRESSPPSDGVITPRPSSRR